MRICLCAFTAKGDFPAVTGAQRRFFDGQRRIIGRYVPEWGI
jgi:hypothetical protein